MPEPLTTDPDPGAASSERVLTSSVTQLPFSASSGSKKKKKVSIRGTIFVADEFWLIAVTSV